MGWIDTIVVTIIIVMGLMIMYRALKEPIDHLGRLLRDGIIWVKDLFTGSVGQSVEVINYG
jgi:hypothetical protein